MNFVDYLYTPDYASKSINHCDLILAIHKCRDMADKHNVTVVPLPKSPIPKSSIDVWNEHYKRIDQICKEIATKQVAPTPEPDSMKRLLRDVECRVRERKDVVNCLKKLGHLRLAQIIERGDNKLSSYRNIQSKLGIIIDPKINSKMGRTKLSTKQLLPGFENSHIQPFAVNGNGPTIPLPAVENRSNGTRTV
jgi:hypothetical protein